MMHLTQEERQVGVVVVVGDRTKTIQVCNWKPSSHTDAMGKFNRLMLA